MKKLKNTFLLFALVVICGCASLPEQSTEGRYNYYGVGTVVFDNRLDTASTLIIESDTIATIGAGEKYSFNYPTGRYDIKAGDYYLNGVSVIRGTNGVVLFDFK